MDNDTKVKRADRACDLITTIDCLCTLALIVFAGETIDTAFPLISFAFTMLLVLFAIRRSIYTTGRKKPATLKSWITAAVLGFGLGMLAILLHLLLRSSL